MVNRITPLLLFIGFVWAQTDFDKLILKDGTTYLGEYSKTEGKIVYFKPQGAFAFQPIPVKRIERLELKDGQIFFNGGGILIAKKNSIHHKRRIKEKAIYDAKSINLNKWAFYAPFSSSIFAGCFFMYSNNISRFPQDSPMFLGGSLAASLAIPYFVLNKEEKFSYPESLANEYDRLYYKKVYYKNINNRKTNIIMASIAITGVGAYLIFMKAMSELDFGTRSEYSLPF